MVSMASTTVSEPAPKSMSTFASTATSGLEGAAIVEPEEFVAQLIAIRVG
jgi:hypothetical protein